MRCKQGDLAIIIKAIRSSNLGKIVTCKEMIGYFIMGEELTWNGEQFVAQDTDYFWVIQAQDSGIDTLFGKSKEALSPDSWLRPLNGEGLDASEDTSTDFEFATDDGVTA